MKGFSKVLLSVAAVMGAMAAFLAVIYKITKKRLKINVEVLPDDIEDENELTAAVDVIDLDIPEAKKDEAETEPEIEISFTEETEA